MLAADFGSCSERACWKQKTENKSCACTRRGIRGEQQTTCWREWVMVGSEEGPADLALQLHGNDMTKRCQLDESAKSWKDIAQWDCNREDIQQFPSVQWVRELWNTYKSCTVPSIGALALRLRSSCATTQSQGANRNRKQEKGQKWWLKWQQVWDHGAHSERRAQRHREGHP